MPLKRIRAAVLYTDPVREVLHQYKYSGYYALATPLADLMVAAWARWQFPVDVVVPVPLHHAREHQRGFNQAALLVSSIGDRLNWNSDDEALWRTRPTRPQLGLNGAERRANVAGAFQGVPERLVDRRVLLIDDVFTTGATLAAAADAALAAGARTVSAYCLATVSTGREFN
ncbi:MAG: phosphoribosyltransferase family protein [Candidatus Promineifilaceae bacterium]|nr:phosphoribosyltransferase family protein [Candidatus Promineifilaceae bacterium]